MSLPPKDDPGQWNHDWSWAFDPNPLDEVFAPIPGIPADRLRVTGKGHVWKNVTPKGNSYKYLRVSISLEGVCRAFHVHDLVLRAFVGARPQGMDCCHYDDDSRNNRIENLRYDTTQANIDDRRRNGKTACGSRKKVAKLREEDVPEVLKMFREGIRVLQIARHFGVTDCPVRAIVRGIAWRHVPRGPLDCPIQEEVKCHRASRRASDYPKRQDG